MAAKKEEKVIDEPKVTANKEPEELNLDAKVTVRSIADWETGFSRIADGSGDIRIMPKGTVRLSRNEIIAQVQNGNALFGGVDGFGTHATLYIDDAPTRAEVGFEDNGKRQLVFTNNLIKDLFKISNQAEFENEFKDSIQTRAEKMAAVRAIRDLKLNDFNKIRFVEDYTGNKV